MKIVEIDETSELWPQLLEVAESYQTNSMEWLQLKKNYFLSSHTVIALDTDDIIGFMRFTIRELPVTYQGEVLLEAFGEALGVNPNRHNEGVGRALQQRSFDIATAKSCYQFRSALYQGADVLAHIKISMGAGIHPERGRTYFIKVL